MRSAALAVMVGSSVVLVVGSAVAGWGFGVSGGLVVLIGLAIAAVAGVGLFAGGYFLTKGGDMRTCPACRKSIDPAARRCPYCTEPSPPAAVPSTARPNTALAIVVVALLLAAGAAFKGYVVGDAYVGELNRRLDSVK